VPESATQQLPGAQASGTPAHALPFFLPGKEKVQVGVECRYGIGSKMLYGGRGVCSKVAASKRHVHESECWQRREARAERISSHASCYFHMFSTGWPPCLVPSLSASLPGGDHMAEGGTGKVRHKAEKEALKAWIHGSSKVR